MPDRVCVGAVAGAYGVGGAVRLKSFCVEPEAIAAYGPLATEDGRTTYTVTVENRIKGGLAARLSGVATRGAAEALKGARLYAERAALPELAEDEFYHADLIGLAVRDTGGAKLGEVCAVYNHGATDLLEIAAPGRRDPVLLSFTEAVVPTVDLAAGLAVADPPEGAMEG